MPELAEVETIRRGLESSLGTQAVIEDFIYYRADLRDPMPKRQLSKLRGQKILAIHRRGKYLLFETPAGFLLSHLGMTGSWRFAATKDRGTHDHFEIVLKDGRHLVYRDPRRFGIIDWTLKPENSPRLQHLGVEPLSENFQAQALRQAAQKRSTPIKAFVMNAEIVVGVGNIYAAESLFRAGIRPTRLVHRVTILEWQNLVKHIRGVLFEAIEAGGSSISDYVQASGDQGGFQKRFAVYDRAGEACSVCNSKIQRKVQFGRSSFFCPKCQR